MSRVAIVGSRDFRAMRLVREYIAALPPGTTIITGGARGVDTVAELTGIARGLKVEVYKADWQKHGKAAGFLRNQTIVDVCERVVAFWDGRSRGTADTIRRAGERGRPVEVVRGGAAHD